MFLPWHCLLALEVLFTGADFCWIILSKATLPCSEARLPFAMVWLRIKGSFFLGLMPSSQLPAAAPGSWSNSVIWSFLPSSFLKDKRFPPFRGESTLIPLERAPGDMLSCVWREPSRSCSQICTETVIWPSIDRRWLQPDPQAESNVTTVRGRASKILHYTPSLPKSKASKKQNNNNNCFYKLSLWDLGEHTCYNVLGSGFKLPTLNC